MSSPRRVENWLLGYRDYTAGTEPPEVFHLWVALSCLATVAQRKIYMDHKFFMTNTNMYVVLVGPSGSRKSTALKLGKKLLKLVPAFGPRIYFSSNAGSTAALIQQFIKIPNKEHQSLTAISSELGSLISTQDTDIVGFLTDIYDCDPGWDKQTIGRGLELIENPWLNLLGATTPDWMTENLGKLSIEGGFVRRVLFVYAEDHGLVAEPDMTPEQTAMLLNLAHDAAEIANVSGIFTYLDSNAREFYRQWYENPARLANIDTRLRGYYECKADHVRKVAMLLSLAENCELKLSEDNLRDSINLLDELEIGMKKALRSVGKNPFNTDLDRIVEQVTGRGKMSYKDLFSLNIHALRKADFDDSLTTLVEIGKIYLEAGTFYSPEAYRKHRAEVSAGPSGTSAPTSS